MTYFTLLYGNKVAKAPGKKVIPAEEFSTLMSAREIVEQAEDEAEAYRKEVAAEGEELKKAAKAEGFEAGQQEWAEQLAQLEAEIAKVRNDYRKSLVPVVLQAARKVVGREISQSPETIADIVANRLKAVAGHKRVRIYCNKQDHENLEAFKEKLEGVFERLESLSIEEREDVEPEGVIIETEAGIINAQADAQWRALETALIALVDKL